MAVSEERGRGFEELLLKLESNDSQNNDNRTRQRFEAQRLNKYGQLTNAEFLLQN